MMIIIIIIIIYLTANGLSCGGSDYYASTDYETNTQIAKELKITPIWTNYWDTRGNGYIM